MLQIAEYLSETGGQSLGIGAIDIILATCEKLAAFPLMGSPRTDLDAELRAFPVLSYIILYHVRDELVTIARVLHQRQDARRIFGVE